MDPIAYAVAKRGAVGILVAFKTEEEAKAHIRQWESPFLEVRAVYAMPTKPWRAARFKK